jgi:glycosyltransferase involved in cell wall biosynthesis
MSAASEPATLPPAADGRPRVLMVTGAYYPELSGASLQCRMLVKMLADRASFAILTTTTDPRLRGADEVDGVPVRRVVLDPGRASSKLRAAVPMARGFVAAAARRDIVHFHGFSQKTIPLIALSRLAHKRIVMKQTSVGHDDAVSLGGRGLVARCAASQVDCFVAPGPAFVRRHKEGPFARAPLRVIPNGVDLNRFAPADPRGRSLARRAIGVAQNARVILHVGFFSPEKGVDILFDAWAATALRWTDSVLVLVGATQGSYREIDPAIARRIRHEAQGRALAARLVFVERADDIERYYRAADIFVLASLREGMPNVLLEAMASGVPSIASRLPGVTDNVIEDDSTGCLVPPGDSKAVATAIDALLGDPSYAAALGAAARRDIAARFSIQATADAYAALYRDLLRPRSST